MQQLTLMKDYKHNEPLRKSLSGLAGSTFGISFERWYQEGFWNERYIPFSYVQGNQVIANVSVTLLDWIINGVKKSAVQIGTVMTHPDYRQRGLSARLMNAVLAEYGDSADFMYLFANDTVLDFYPRFGFIPEEEHLFSMDFSAPPSGAAGIRKLDMESLEDLAFIAKFAEGRLPVSKRFGTGRTQGLLMFYCLNVFNDDIYYLENEDVIVIYKNEGKQLELFDIISHREFRLEEILTKLASRDTEKVLFHYTPDYEGIPVTSTPHNSGLFIRAGGDNIFPDHVKHPVTSIA
ncbi:GNAT family N-acetyltransferase [Paenibacillus sonchi]|uniref:GNAT family N-acetyltransferase n=1 Tax=Paenibacillus sonchi TaxID=373687 RepID=UPI001E57ADC2|nr:GNAT family N-acetyltransferase [Paenibacillus sonchi]MCE3198829.1 GNAT family N-acetyltransferase [Paenibacillus sonchi]